MGNTALSTPQTGEHSYTLLHCVGYLKKQKKTKEVLLELRGHNRRDSAKRLL